MDTISTVASPKTILQIAPKILPTYKDCSKDEATLVELPYIFCKNLSDFPSKIWKTMHYACRYLGRSCKKMSEFCKKCLNLGRNVSTLDEMSGYVTMYAFCALSTRVLLGSYKRASLMMTNTFKLKVNTALKLTLNIFLLF